MANHVQTVVRLSREQGEMTMSIDKLFATMGQSYRNQGLIIEDFLHDLLHLSRLKVIPRMKVKQNRVKFKPLETYADVPNFFPTYAGSFTREVAIQPSYANGKTFSHFLLPYLLLNDLRGVPVRFHSYAQSPSALLRVKHVLRACTNRKECKNTSVWVAPTQAQNEAIAFKGVHLDESLCAMNFAYGKYVVWGFSEAFPGKWDQLRKGDMILFGRKKSKTWRRWYVHRKFIWNLKMSEGVFPYVRAHPWRYGFTLRDGSIINDEYDIAVLANYGFQTQTRLRDSEAEFWLKERVVSEDK